MPTGTKCQNFASGPSGDKTFHFRNYNLRKSIHYPYGAPYFHFNAHRINLKQNGSDIDVTAQLRVNSHGFKTNATAPVGVAPQILYTVSFGNGSVKEVPNWLDVPFDCNTQNGLRTLSSSIPGEDANDAIEVCWDLVRAYRIVECGSL